MAMGDPPSCPNCGNYICGCYNSGTKFWYGNSTNDILGSIFVEAGINHCRDGSIELRDAKFEVVFTLPIDGGIIFSDEFLSALSAQLSGHQDKQESKS